MNTETTTSPLRAWHGKRALRTRILNRVEAHRKADEIIAGSYWDGKRGCSAGCALHVENPHAVVEQEIGFPRILFRLNDRLFESIYPFAPDVAKAWPKRFLAAAKTGADLTMVWPQFAHWLLVDETDGVIKFAKTDRIKEAIKGVATLYRRWLDGSKPPASEWESVRRIADAAAYAAAYADDAADAYAAAYADAYAAAYADDAAAYADDTAYADAAARQKHYLRMAEKLIELMEAST